MRRGELRREDAAVRRGETCCEEQSWMPDDYIVHYNTCLPLQQQSELTALGYV